MCWKHWSCENEVRSTRNSFGYEVRSKRYHYSWILPLIVFSNSDILVLCRVETHYIHYLPCLPKGGRKHHSAWAFFYQNRKHIIRTWLRIYWDFYMVICLLNKKKRRRRIFDISPASHGFWESVVEEKVGKSWQCLRKGEKTPEETDSRNYIAEEYESANVPRTGDLQCVG